MPTLKKVAPVFELKTSFYLWFLESFCQRM